jgi:hypothetical protein
LVAIVLAMFSCSNASNDKAEPTTTTPAAPPATPPVAPAQPKKDNVKVEVKKDTPRTEISIGQKGGSIKTKKGTGVSIDDKGLKVGSKDVKIDIKKDSL